jgi:hypothetical protein
MLSYIGKEKVLIYEALAIEALAEATNVKA